MDNESVICQIVFAHNDYLYQRFSVAAFRPPSNEKHLAS